MRRTEIRPLTMIAQHIRAAFPRNTVKHLERGLGCSGSQADRIVKTGRAPREFRERLIELLEAAFDRNERELRKLREDLRLREYADNRTASDSPPRVVGTMVAPDHRPAAQTEIAFVKDE